MSRAISVHGRKKKHQRGRWPSREYSSLSWESLIDQNGVSKFTSFLSPATSNWRKRIATLLLKCRDAIGLSCRLVRADGRKPEILRLYFTFISSFLCGLSSYFLLFHARRDRYHRMRQEDLKEQFPADYLESQLMPRPYRGRHPLIIDRVLHSLSVVHQRFRSSLTFDLCSKPEIYRLPSNNSC